MISPPTAHLQVLRGKALKTKPKASNERDRSFIVRLNIRLQTMKIVLVKSLANNLNQTLAHQSTTNIGNKSIVAEVT